MARVIADAGPPENVAPPGLKGLIVADTAVGTVRGEEGWYHYRGHDATALARQHSFDAVAHLLLEGSLPDPATEAAFREALGEARALTPTAAELVASLAGTELSPLAILRSALGLVVDSRPTLDLSPAERRNAVLRAIDIETRLLAFLADWRPSAVIVTNVEYYAAVVLHLAGLPQEAFTPTFTTSRIVGWGAHLLEQAADNKIIRPSARYTGPLPPRP